MEEYCNSIIQDAREFSMVLKALLLLKVSGAFMFMDFEDNDPIFGKKRKQKKYLK